eukprot:COSAG01_NODE_1992_length_8696_cov_4.370827_6_plen_748_part_00
MMWRRSCLAAELLLLGAVAAGVGAPRGAEAGAAASCPSGSGPVDSPALLPQKWCSKHSDGFSNYGWVDTPDDDNALSSCEAACEHEPRCASFTVGTPCTKPGGRSHAGGCWLKSGDCSNDLHNPSDRDCDDYGANPVTRVIKSGICTDCAQQKGLCHNGALGGTPTDFKAAPALGLHMLRNTSEECCALCRATEGCYAWSFVGVDMYAPLNPNGTFPRTPPGQKMCYLRSGCGEVKQYDQQYEDAVSGWSGVECNAPPVPNARVLRGHAGDACVSSVPGNIGDVLPSLPGSPRAGDPVWCPAKLTKPQVYEAECVPGFRRKGDLSTAQFRCSEGGKWKQANKDHPLVCSPTYCNNRLPVENTQLCPGEQFHPDRENSPASTCQANCSVGYKPEDPTANRTYVCTSSPGSFNSVWRGHFVCVPDCPKGMAKLGGVGDCVKCGPGEYSDGGQRCTTCKTDAHLNLVPTADQSDCQFCGPGHGPNKGSSECVLCPEGKRSPGHGGICEDCAPSFVGSADDRVTCGSRKFYTGLIVFLVVAAMMCVICSWYVCCKRKLRGSANMEQASALRQSLLGGSRELPENILAEKVRLCKTNAIGTVDLFMSCLWGGDCYILKVLMRQTLQDIGPRWTAARLVPDRPEDAVSSATMTSVRSTEVTMPSHRQPQLAWMGARTVLTRCLDWWQVIATGGRRRAKSPRASAPLAVMFENQHLSELEPKDWRRNKLGQGSYGAACICYSAWWLNLQRAVHP